MLIFNRFGKNYEFRYNIFLLRKCIKGGLWINQKKDSIGKLAAS